MAGEDKDFIKEKIIGRNISFKNAVKRILLALICGLVFGAGGALAFFTVSEAGRRFTEAKEAGQELSDDASQEAEAQGTELQEEENSGDVSSDEGAAADGELSDKAWEYAGQVADPLFAEAGIGPDRSEVFLVGTHMEMALAAMAAEVQ